MTLAAPAAGLREPVHDAQAVFRALMNAMARPGTIHALPQPLDPPAPLSRTAGLVLLSLADVDTPIWLDAPLAAGEAVADWLRFHTGAPITTDQMEAGFVVVADAERLPSPGGFACGTIEYPDRSATFVVQVESLAEDEGLALEGPGIRGRRLLSVAPMSPALPGQLRDNHAKAPRGVDFIFAAPGAVAALPRSSRVVGAEGDA